VSLICHARVDEELRIAPPILMLAEKDLLAILPRSLHRVLEWDGKDNDGKLVKNGKYTVFFEVVREHGTYQLM
jgi:Predicted periplasmic protein (DUF2271)